MHRIQVLRDHIRPNLESNQDQITSSPTSALSTQYDHKQLLQLINSGGHVQLAQKLGNSYYTFNHENIISKLHQNGCLSIALNRVKHYNALSYGKKNYNYAFSND
jgi:hypothetical protein